MPRVSSRPERIERKTIDGVKVKISLHADFAHLSSDQRMEIEYDGHHWVFGIDEDTVVSTISTTVVRAELPDWLVRSFRSPGLEVDE